MISRVKEIYAHHDVMEHEIDLYSTFLGFPSPLLEVALSRSSSSIGDPGLLDVKQKRVTDSKISAVNAEKEKDKPVSYTHLTLPTNREV